jgi:predicted transport protein
MLIIDGARYRLRIPEDEEKEFQPIIKKHYKEIFGQDTIYFDINVTLRSLAGLGSKPEGFVIDLSKNEWYIVEVELSKHNPYDHIVNQLTRFVNAIDNPAIKSKVVDVLYDEIDRSRLLRAYIEEKIKGDIHHWLSKLLSQTPKIAVIIEKKTGEVIEACKILMKDFNTHIMEFNTFIREDAPNVHAHLFEPLYVTEKVSEEGKEGKVAQGRYTESYHLKNVAKDIISVYEKIKNAMLKLDSNIIINSQKYYISLRKNKNFAYIQLRKTKMHIVIMLPYEDGSNLIKKHELTTLSQGIQNWYGAPCFKVTLESEENLEEVIKALEEAYKQQS